MLQLLASTAVEVGEVQDCCLHVLLDLCEVYCLFLVSYNYHRRNHVNHLGEKFNWRRKCILNMDNLLPVKHYCAEILKTSAVLCLPVKSHEDSGGGGVECWTFIFTLTFSTTTTVESALRAGRTLPLRKCRIFMKIAS